ncbi:MAG: hypothetical protein HW421_152 [Ignavibacteria bacterium]|nr:hypothetical protein [Ignavibacteria bacterium]
MEKSDWQKEIYKHREYWGKVIAISDNKIIETADSSLELYEKMKKTGIIYISHSVPTNPNLLRILTLRIKSMRQDLWEPFYPVKFLLPDGNYEEREMLIDSGADISAIGFEFGNFLGFEAGVQEVPQVINGIGGEINYLLREQKIEIAGFSFVNKFAWLQEPTSSEMIIGRTIVFDLFDIEFKQGDKELIFRKR